MKALDTNQPLSYPKVCNLAKFYAILTTNGSFCLGRMPLLEQQQSVTIVFFHYNS